MVEVIRSLFDEHGVSLLNNPLRFEGFIKDLFPSKERDVFLICEAHFAGYVQRICRERLIQETQRQALALEFVSQCGVAIVHACWVMDTWVESLPQWAYEEQVEKQFTGTLDEVLGMHLQ
jgi:hypothetical protein